MPTIALVDDDRHILTSVSMALEAQAKAAVYHDDSYLDYFFRKMLESLFGDKKET